MVQIQKELIESINNFFMKEKDSSILATEKGAKNSSSDYNEEKPKSKPKRKKWSLRKKILVSFFSIVFIAGLYFVSAVIYNLKTLSSHLIKPKNGTYTGYYMEKVNSIGFNGRLDILNKLDFSAKRGNKKFEMTYVDGELNGLYRSWWVSGIKGSEMTYVDGKLNGPYKSWNSSGIKKIDANILNDTLHGYFKEFNEGGKNIRSGEYSMGERVGIWDIVGYKVRLPVKEKEDGYYFFDSQGNPILVISKIQTKSLTIDEAYIVADDSELGDYSNWRLPYISEAKYFYALNYLHEPNLKTSEYTLGSAPNEFVYSKGLECDLHYVWTQSKQSRTVWIASDYYTVKDPLSIDGIPRRGGKIPVRLVRDP